VGFSSSNPAQFNPPSIGEHESVPISAGNKAGHHGLLHPMASPKKARGMVTKIFATVSHSTAIQLFDSAEACEIAVVTQNNCNSGKFFKNKGWSLVSSS
jgi:hypothetical protein